MALEVLLGFLLVFAVVTVLGHAQWLVIASLYRLLTGTNAKPHSPPSVRSVGCHVCGHGIAPDATECDYCGSPQAVRNPAVPTVIATNQIDRLVAEKRLDPSQATAVRMALAEHLRSLPLELRTGLPIIPQVNQQAAPASGLASTNAAPSNALEPGLTQSASPQASGAETGMPAAPAETVSRPVERISFSSDPEKPTSVADVEQQAIERAKNLKVLLQQPAASQATGVQAAGAQAVSETPVMSPSADSFSKQPAKPRRSFLELFTAFMEEKHIRWGELVGGLLIVCCSIALVISFWSKIAERPFLKFGVFNGVTAALFGLGIHAARRWKLPTSSKGMLIIASLLLPLNFLAIAAFTSGPASNSPWVLLAEAISIVAFAWLTTLAGQELCAGQSKLYAASVMLPSIWQLLVRRFVDPDAANYLLIGMTSVPGIIYSTIAVLGLRHIWTEKPLAESTNHRVLRLLGVSSFATSLPIGLLYFKAGLDVHHLYPIAPLMVLFALPALIIGIVMWKHNTIEQSTYRLTGTSLVVAAGFMMLAGVVFSWPQPVSLFATSVIAFALITLIAVTMRMPEVHVGAGAAGLVAYVIGMGWTLRTLPWFVDVAGQTIQGVMHGAIGNTILGFVTLYGVMAWVSRRKGAEETSKAFVQIAACAAVVSLALVGYFGLLISGDPLGATWTFLAYAVLAIVTAIYRRQQRFAAVGWGLLLVSIVQGVVFIGYKGLQDIQPWLVAVILYAVISVLVDWLQSSSTPISEKLRFGMGHTTRVASLISGAVAAVLYSFSAAGSIDTVAVWPLFVIAIVWFLQASVSRGQTLWSISELAIAAAVSLFVHQWIVDPAVYPGVGRGDVLPSNLQIYGFVWLGLAVFWLVFRMFSVRWSTRADALPTGNEHSGPELQMQPRSILGLHFPELLRNTPLQLDTLALTACTSIVVLLGAMSALPGIGQELTLRQVAAVREVPEITRLELFGIPHEAANDWASWLLMGAVIAVLAVFMRYRYRLLQVLGVAFCLGASTLLAASLFEGQVAVASALRWATAIAFCGASVVVWTHRSWIRALGISLHSIKALPQRYVIGEHALIGLLIAIGSPLIIMVGGLVVNALGVSQPSANELWWLQVLGVTALVGVTLGIGAIASKRWQFTAYDLAADPALKTRVRAQQSLYVAMLLMVAPLAVMAIYIISAGLRAHPIVGPDPTSLFHRVGLPVSYGIPLLICGITIVGHAIYQRSARLAFTGAMAINFCVVTLYLLSGVKQIDFGVWVHVAQLLALTSASYGIVWQVYLHRWLAIKERPTATTQPLSLLGLTALAFACANLIPALIWLFVKPTTLEPLAAAAGVLGWSSWIVVGINSALLFGCGSLLSRGNVTQMRDVLNGVIDRLDPAFWLVCACVSAALAALQIQGHQGGAWTAYGVAWFGLMTIATAAMFVVTWDVLTGRSARTTAPEGWRAFWILANILPTIVFLGALRTLGNNPLYPWGAIIGLLCLALLVILRGIQVARRRFFYEAAAFLVIAAHVSWLEFGVNWWSRAAVWSLLSSCQVIVIALTIPAALWRWIDERFVVSRRPSVWPGCHRVVAAIALVMQFTFVAVSLGLDFFQSTSSVAIILPWIALTTTLTALLVTLWDRRAVYAESGLYLAGLVTVAQFVDAFDLAPRVLVFLATVTLGAYGVLTSYLASREHWHLTLAQALKIPPREFNRDPSRLWLKTANHILAITVAALTFYIQWTYPDVSQRIIAAQATLAQVLSLGLLARGTARGYLHKSALTFGVLGSIAFGWAFIKLDSSGILLERWIATIAALVVTAAVYGFGLIKLWRQKNAWTETAVEMVPVLVFLALIGLAGELATEIGMYVIDGKVQVAWSAIFIVALSLIGLTAAALAAALLPGRDPLNLSAAQKQWYVYGAEALLLVLFLHVRVTMPFLFHGMFMKYWPLIVLALAFLGIGLSEYFKRRMVHVLAEPLERTGIMLPLLPVIGFWVIPTQVHYSLVMILIGAIYGVLAATRRSFGFGILATLACNGGMWYWLHHANGLGFLNHPQVWLIPPAICMLVASYLNRNHLDDARRTTIRYLCSIIIYTSSTAEVFIHGVGEAPWLPVILAGLSLVGIAMGIVMRVRAFLFLGTSFLVLSLMTVIWWAAHDLQQTWLWFVTGIVAGIVILAIFAAFEKKRQEIQSLVEKLKAWEA